MSLSGEVWVHKTSLTPPLFIEVPVLSQECEWPCICVLGVMYMCVRSNDFASDSTIFILDFRTVRIVLYLFLFHLTNIVYNCYFNKHCI